MARKIYPYSLDSMDAKVAGVCSTIGRRIGVDPTFVRIGFVAAAILISFKLTLVAIAAALVMSTVAVGAAVGPAQASANPVQVSVNA